MCGLFYYLPTIKNRSDLFLLYWCPVLSVPEIFMFSHTRMHSGHIQRIPEWLTSNSIPFPPTTHTSINFITFYFMSTDPLGFLPWEILINLSQLHSCNRTLTLTTGSLTYACDVFCSRVGGDGGGGCLVSSLIRNKKKQREQLNTTAYFQNSLVPLNTSQAHQNLCDREVKLNKTYHHATFEKISLEHTENANIKY